MKILGNAGNSKAAFFVNDACDKAFTGYAEDSDLFDGHWEEIDQGHGLRPFKRWIKTLKPEWTPRSKFYLEMKFTITYLSRGRSSTQVHVTDLDTGYSYTMGPSAILLLLKSIQESKFTHIFGAELNGETVDGFKGTFTIEKQGSNYYLMPYLGE